MTIAAVAAHKQITLEKIEVRIVCRVEGRSSISSDFSIRVDLGSGLTQREKTILLNVARTCEVSKMLSGNMHYDYKLTS